MDDDTKILILPQPESKRKVKIVETVYSLKTYKDLFDMDAKVESSLKPETEEVKRYEDKTKEEIEQDMLRKRKQQFGRLVKYRTY